MVADKIDWDTAKAVKHAFQAGPIGAQAKGFIDGSLGRPRRLDYIKVELQADYLAGYDQGFQYRHKNAI